MVPSFTTFPRLFLFILLVVPGTLRLAWAQEPLAEVSDPIADAIWEDFQRIPWDSTARAWTGADQGQRQRGCEEFHGDGSGKRADDEWCYRCVRRSREHESRWFFYVFSLEEPLTCKLEQFESSAEGIPLNALEVVHQSLEKRLTERFGAPDRPEPRMGGYAESGSAAWRSVRRWENEEIQILLYVYEHPSSPPRTGLLARHRHLRDAMAEEQKRPYWFEWGKWSAGLDSPIDRIVVRELGKEFPELRVLRGEDPARTIDERSQDVFRSLVTRLVKAAESAAENRKPLLLLAADRVTTRIQPPEPDSPESEKVLEELARLGLNFSWAPLGTTWVSTHDLAFQLVQEYPNTPEGEAAFVYLLNRGWDTTGVCTKGSDQFREVIRRGEEFLKDRPESKYRLDVSFAVAQAYETWCSLSKASLSDTYADRNSYRDGAPEACQKATALYEEVVRSAPDTYEAEYARERLPRLKLGIDTNQRRFFCVYD